MTATLTLPLVAWGSPDDISAYTSVGTPVVTSGVTDPFGGTGAYTIDDNDGVASEYKSRAIVPASASTPLLGVFVKAGTATATEFGIFDSTASLQLLTIRLDWSGGVPTASETSVSDAVALTPVAVGNGWYFCSGYSNAPYVVGNSTSLRLFGALQTASATGSTSYYVRNAVLLSYLDGATTWPEPRKGSAWAEAPSGTEDAWIVGTNWHLAGTVRHVPDTPTDTPETVSGWYGANEATGVNCGVAAMLSAGRDKQALRWVKDRATCTTYVDGYLVEPMRGRPELEPNWRRTFPIELRSSSVYGGY